MKPVRYYHVQGFLLMLNFITSTEPVLRLLTVPGMKNISLIGFGIFIQDQPYHSVISIGLSAVLQLWQ